LTKIDYLARATGLKEVNLSKNSITDGSGSVIGLYLSKARTLVSFDISHNYISDSGITPIAD
jgi:Leucine-rich repeat (LRR) protein